MGGVVATWVVDPDVLSYTLLCDRVKEAGYGRVERFYYLPPGSIFEEGLVIAYDNASLFYMLAHMSIEREIHVYCEHGLDVVDIDIGLLPNLENNDEASVDGDGVDGLDGLNLDGNEDINSELEGGLVNVNVLEAGAHEGYCDDSDKEPLGGLEWSSDKDDEEIQEIRENCRQFREKKKKRNVNANEVPSEIAFNDLVEEIKKQKKELKKSNYGEGSLIRIDDGDETDYIDSSDMGSYESGEEGDVMCTKSSTPSVPE